MTIAQPQTMAGCASKIAVVIATKDREDELANRALPSVAQQTRPPDYLVVVDDSHPRHRYANRRIVCGVATPAGASTCVHYLSNTRTPGASGAWNVGLDWLHRQVDDPDDLFVAILDDDDRWDPDYLASCAQLAAAGTLDMVATDILRHEAANEPGVAQAAPDTLRARSFLVTNPGIQGSNLFVRLGTLLAAGLFDESLPSSTDRDLCIRIAELGDIRYARLDRTLVHHHADHDRPRLSTPSSPAKLDGLTGFYRKYRGRMSDEERAAFCKRAEEKFGWQPPANSVPVRSRNAAPAAIPTSAPLSLVVGMTTSSAGSPDLAALLDDLARLQGQARLASLDIVFLENGPRKGDDGNPLSSAAEALRSRGVGTLVIPLERQERDATAGLFGKPFSRGMDRVSIATARTMLQAYLYLWARQRPGAVVWVLDDDMRLDNLVWRGGHRAERSPLDVVDAVIRLRDSGVAVAIGTCTDAPPVPFATCIRTQLVDAWHNFELLAAMSPDEPFPERLGENMALRDRFKDYYYDLSRRETDHLETPFWYVPRAEAASAEQVLLEMVKRLPRILGGEEVFRPLIQDAAIDPLDRVQPSVHRGGNTFIFDLQALWDFPNQAPTIDGTNTRRSDMVWSLLNRYAARRRVVKVPVPVRQDRGANEIQRLDLEKLVRDIHGYAAYSALDDLMLDRCEQRRRRGDAAAPDDLCFDEEDMAYTIGRFNKYVKERLYAFQLSFYRAAGLIRSFRRYLDARGGWWWVTDPRFAAVAKDLDATLELFSAEYDLSRLPAFQAQVLNVDDTQVREWLNSLRMDVLARKASGDADRDATAWLEGKRVENTCAQVTAAFGKRQLRPLGCGAEGVVLTDGVTVYKCFDAGRLGEHQLAFLRSQTRRWRDSRTLHCIDDLRTSSGPPILTYADEDSSPYQGGRGDQLRILLDECRALGIVCTNIHPDNLVVTRQGELKLVDYGADIQPFSEDGWLLMARRTYLSGRHAHRPDLKDLMRRSLEDGSLPELSGLDTFLRARPFATKATLLDARVREMVLSLDPRNVLDYGCGSGQITASLARSGIDSTGYDPDPALAEKWKRHGDGPRFFCSAAPLDARRPFDVVICSLVLCVIEDDEELLRVIGDLSRLVARDGHVLVAVCNPHHVSRSTLLQQREPPADVSAKIRTWKTLRASGVRRLDVHRPLRMLLRAFSESGLWLMASEETESIDPDTLEASSDFLLLQFHQESERNA